MKKLITLLLLCTLTGCSAISGIVLDKAEITPKPVQTEKANLPNETKEPQKTTEPEAEKIRYIGNKNSYIFHYPYCPSVEQMKEKNKRPLKCTRDEAIERGYDPCGRCNP